MKWLFSIFFAGTILTHYVASSENPEQRTNLKLMKQQAKRLQGMARVDATRRAVLRKIARIIDGHNTTMSEELKSKIAAEIHEMSQKYPNLDVDLICATITHESGYSWDPEVRSRAGAMGLMQIMPPTGQWLAKYEGIRWTTAREILYNPIYNIRLGSRYLSALIETYDLEGGLAAYNGGTKRVELWLANNKAVEILWPETRSYIPFVLKIYEEYKSSAMGSL